MGQLSPTRRGQANLCPCRYGHLQSPVAMGTAETPEERQTMCEGSVLRTVRKPELALLREGKRQRGKNHPQLAVPGLRNTNNPVQKDQRRLQSLRSGMGNLP